MVRKSALFPSAVVSLLVGSIFLACSVGNLYAETLSFSIDLTKEAVSIETEPGVTAVRVDAVGCDRLIEEGSPELPYKIVNVLLSPGTTMESYAFTSSPGMVVLKDAVIKKAGPMIAEDGTVGRGPSLLGAAVGEAAYPADLGRYLGTGVLHGRSIASFAVFPLRMVSGDLVLTERVTLEVTAGASDGGEAIVVRERYREGFQAGVAWMLEGLVTNPELNAAYEFGEVRVEKRTGGFAPTSYPSLEGSPVDYLIITTDALAGEYQRLADWKTVKGVPTVVRTAEWIEANTRNGVDLQETLRFFIQDAYAKWGITYVLLGGDTDILPPRYALSRYINNGTELPVDMYFSCLDGSWNDNHNKYWGEGFKVIPYDNPDLYPEVYNGRISRSDPTEVSLVISPKYFSH